MQIAEWLSTRVVERYRVFGVRAATLQILKKIVAPLYNKESYWALAADQAPGVNGPEHSIIRGDQDFVQSAIRSGKISGTEAHRFEVFAKAGCQGFFALVDGTVAGWAWVQQAGMYDFGQGGIFRIPEGLSVFNNGYVRPKFRDVGIATALTRARMNWLAGSATAITFVLAENRYSLRYCQRCGFVPLVFIARSRWFNGRWRTNAHAVSDCVLSRKILSGLRLLVPTGSVAEPLPLKRQTTIRLHD